MKRISFKYLIIILSVLLVYNCSTYPSRREFNAESNRYCSDTARFLAGMPVSRDSLLWHDAQSVSYKKHAVYMDKFWSRVEKETIRLIAPWRTRYLSQVKGDVAFYPLSGADFVNLYTMYPDARNYIMIALEGTGDMPDPLKQSPEKISNMLESLRDVTLQYGRLNYFLSKIMAEELCRDHKIGTTPPLLVFLARLGHDVVKVEKIGIDDAGSLQPLDESGRIGGKNPEAKGMRFIFFAPDDPRPRVLVYLNMRLSNETVDPSSPTGKYLHSLDKVKTIMKSAIYLMFLRSFAAVKDFVLSKSIAIVQDDSGIPFQDLNNENWDVKIFGVYIPRYPIKGGCTIHKQKDLKESFDRGSLPLPFNFGYGSLLGKEKSNVILAVRKKKQ